MRASDLIKILQEHPDFEVEIPDPEHTNTWVEARGCDNIIAGFTRDEAGKKHYERPFFRFALY